MEGTSKGDIFIGKADVLYYQTYIGYEIYPSVRSPDIIWKSSRFQVLPSKNNLLKLLWD